jgi:hypothetical protein
LPYVDQKLQIVVSRLEYCLLGETIIEKDLLMDTLIHNRSQNMHIDRVGRYR